MVKHARQRRIPESAARVGPPSPLEEGAEVEVEVRTAETTPEEEDEAWRELGLSRMEEEWDNPEDAVYDDWMKLYGG